MQVNLTTPTGQSSEKTVDLSDATFGAKFNESLVHQVVTAYLAGGRAGTRAQKTRSEVRGGGAKPWRQKGTGRARAGTNRSPLWTGGGKIFPAKPRDFSQKVNRKMYRGAIRAIVSELLRQDRLIVVEDLQLEAPKTRELVDKLKALQVDNVLIVTEQLGDNLALAARNLYWVDVLEAGEIDPVSLINRDKVLVTVGAIKQIEERLQ